MGKDKYPYRRTSGHVGHPCAEGRWHTVREHVLIAERALGKYLPAGAEVHHVDENTLNNEPSNLVICQDKAYHKLLHWRASVIRAGGNPNTHKPCGICMRVLLFAEFRANRSNKSHGLRYLCYACARERDRERYRQGRRGGRRKAA